MQFVKQVTFFTRCNCNLYGMDILTED